MDWKQLYKQRCVSADTAVRKTVTSGCRIFLTGNCSIPKTLLSALVNFAPELQDVEICHALTLGPSDFCAPELKGHLRSNSLFIGPSVRKAIWEGRADFTPVLLSELTLLFKRGVLPLDVCFAHISPPDENGYCTHGIETGITKTAAECAKAVVAQVNPNMPRMNGDTLIHVSDIDYIVEVNDEIHEHKMADEPNSKVYQAIAEHVAELIPDGATLQAGIGAIPDMVLHFLENKKNLGVHTELFSDGLWGLVEKGIINNSMKTIHPGKIISGLVLGSRKLYDKIHCNPIVELHRQEYINDPFVISQNYRQVAINSAIEIDLTGQVCSDSIGPKFFSGAGGQLDFIYGASRSEGGVPIIALPAAAKDDKVSRITPTLKRGAGVITTRNHVHWVVTEYGAVNLYGQSARQRAAALISIAHPNFRDKLRWWAKRLQYI